MIRNHQRLTCIEQQFIMRHIQSVYHQFRVWKPFADARKINNSWDDTCSVLCDLCWVSEVAVSMVSNVQQSVAFTSYYSGIKCNLPAPTKRRNSDTTDTF